MFSVLTYKVCCCNSTGKIIAIGHDWFLEDVHLHSRASSVLCDEASRSTMTWMTENLQLCCCIFFFFLSPVFDHFKIFGLSCIRICKSYWWHFFNGGTPWLLPPHITRRNSGQWFSVQYMWHMHSDLGNWTHKRICYCWTVNCMIKINIWDWKSNGARVESDCLSEDTDRGTSNGVMCDLAAEPLKWWVGPQIQHQINTHLAFNMGNGWPDERLSLCYLL